MSDTWDPELLQWRSAGKRVISSVKMSSGAAVEPALTVAQANFCYPGILASDTTGGLPVAYTTRYLAPDAIVRSYWAGVGFTRREGERLGLLRTVVHGWCVDPPAADEASLMIEHIDGDEYATGRYETVRRSLPAARYEFSFELETYVDESWDGERVASSVTLTNAGVVAGLGLAVLNTTVTWEPLS